MANGLVVRGSLDLGTVGTDEYKIGGNRALAMPIATSNMAFGASGMNSVIAGATYNVSVGDALSSLTTGDHNLGLGNIAEHYNITGSDNISIGQEAGRGLTGTSHTGNINIGMRTGRYISTGSYNVSLGFQTAQGDITGITGTDNVSIGRQAGYNLEGGGNNVFLGYRSGSSVTDGDYNICMGRDAGVSINTGSYNVCVGYFAGEKLESASYAVAIGSQSQRYTTVGDNVSIGNQALQFNATGAYNVAIGVDACRGGSGRNQSRNVMIGYRTGYLVTSADDNMVIGHEAARSLSSGVNNVIFGRQAGYNIGGGSSNIFMGYNAGYNESGSNKLYIENSNSASPLIYGEFDNDIVEINGELHTTGNVGIGSTAPVEKVDINQGNIHVDDIPSSDTSATGGVVVSMTVDANATGFRAALHMDTDSNWIEADANAASTMPCQALAMESGTGSKKVLMQGFVRDDSWAWTVGGTIYVSETTGALTQTQPSTTGAQIQAVGFATHADRMYFNPDYTVVEIA